ncbi:MAG: hypothetical protein APF80_12270 [Alphaproteobacteria bacterium BRH_c36]|nr:MAG: hypothetical protein APF80_12270 [Alphaproteobacteria bacterium BRH_c36]
MFRSLTLAAALASTFALTAAAQDKPAAPAEKAMTPSITIKAPDATAIKLTADEAKGWVGKPVYSSDDKNLGEVAAFARSSDNTVTEMHIDIGGFLGIGETRVKLTPAQFKLQKDRVVLDVNADAAKNLPKVKN